MPLAKDGRSQKVLIPTLDRMRDRAAKISAADPLHRKVTFDQALNWMLDRLDQLDQLDQQGDNDG